MAAAEATAGWQHIANRCFVQEDARGAPKLPRCPSSSSKAESGSIPVDAAKTSDRPVPGFMPHNRNSSNPDVLLDTKWWLHPQPNSEHLKNFYKEQLEEDLGVLHAGSVNHAAKLVRENQLMEEYGTQSCTQTNAVSLVDQPWRAFPASRKDDKDGKVQDLEDINCENLQKKPMHKDIEELWDAQVNLIESEPCNCLASEQPKKVCSELDSNWIGEENTEPWWRTADKDELASLVSHKSLEYFENCDLPRPHSKYFGFAFASPHGLDSPFRDNTLSTPKANDEEIHHETNGDLSKVQLIEALCHSQTRAREAEKAAQHAYDEKDHILKLFFRQASHLFAYKQWLQILQLQTLCHQLKNNYPLSTCFPDFLPHKGKKLRKGRRTAAKKRPVPPRYNASNCAFAFAVGLGLAGAGLLLGWTMGWLYPSLFPSL